MAQVSSQKGKRVQKPSAIKRFLGPALLIAAVLLCAVFLASRPGKNQEYSQLLSEKTSLLKEAVSSAELDYTLAADTPERVVFLSVCNTEEAAYVFHGTGDTLDEAWTKALSEADTYIQDKDIQPVWVKADVVHLSQKSSVDLLERTIENNNGAFRCGVSFDQSFKSAFLESELIGANAVNYEEATISLGNLQSYAERQGTKVPDAYSDGVILFQTAGWICDESNTIYKLYADGNHFGRRVIEDLNVDYLQELVDDSVAYLANGVGEKGQFIYNYYPTLNATSSQYNIVRHAGVLWALIEQYETAPSEELKNAIYMAADYLQSCVVMKDSETAFVLGENDSTITLGTSGLSLAALSRFKEVFNDDSYLLLCHQLGNGILYLQDGETGQFQHILNTDYTAGEKFKTVYYDGEALFGLSCLYGVTKDQKYLDAAELAASYFISANYDRFYDHWIAYAMNELTKYAPKPEYFQFGLKATADHLSDILEEGVNHCRMEQFMAMFEMWDRMTSEGIDAGYVLDKKAFIDAVEQGINDCLDLCYFPEFAMYAVKPDKCVELFYSRGENLSIRMDNLQHSIIAFKAFSENYSKLTKLGFAFQP